MDPISTPFCNTLIYTQLYHLVGPKTFETAKQGRRKGVAGGTSVPLPIFGWCAALARCYQGGLIRWVYDSNPYYLVPPPSPKLVMQMRPPSLYLAQSIRINDGQDEATVGVSGVEITVRFIFLKFYIDLQLDNLNHQSFYLYNSRIFYTIWYSTQLMLMRSAQKTVEIPKFWLAT